MKKTKPGHYLWLHGPDTDVPGFILEQMLRALLKRTKPDREHDIPYLAGYSCDGKTIYINRELPRYFIARLPVDMDIKPYRDERDWALLHRMQCATNGAGA